MTSTGVEITSTSDMAALPAGRLVYSSPDRSVRVVLDSEEFEWYVEATEEADPEVIEAFLSSVVYPLGYELIEDDECPSEWIAPRQTWRTFLAPVIPVDDTHYDAGRAGIGFMSALVGIAFFSPFVHDAMSTIMEVVTS